MKMKTSKLLGSFAAFFVLLIAACQNRDSNLPTPPEGSLPKYRVTDFAAPEQCASCHPNHYNEWRSSMHAYAFVDPVFFAMHERGQKETGGKLDQFCAKCHGPIASPTANTYHQSGYDAGFERSEICGVCHEVRNDLGVKIEETFGEWTRAALAGMSFQCQNCHMRTYAGQAATTGPQRAKLHHHYFAGV